MGALWQISSPFLDAPRLGAQGPDPSLGPPRAMSRLPPRSPGLWLAADSAWVKPAGRTQESQD